MTLIEKIKNYKWFDSPNKLKPILEELYNSIGGGGSQDLQSVLDNGSDVSESAIVFFETPNSDNKTTISGEGMFSQATNRNHIFYPNGSVIANENKRIDRGIYYTAFSDSLTQKLVFVNYRLGNGNFDFPNKPTGNYTLATLDDIKKIDFTGRIYANNAAAISGGLTTNDVYRTSTGELRIVV